MLQDDPLQLHPGGSYDENHPLETRDVGVVVFHLVGTAWKCFCNETLALSLKLLYTIQTHRYIPTDDHWTSSVHLHRMLSVAARRFEQSDVLILPVCSSLEGSDEACCCALFRFRCLEIRPTLAEFCMVWGLHGFVPKFLSLST